MNRTISARALGSQLYTIDTDIKIIRFEAIKALCNVTLNFYLPWRIPSTLSVLGGARLQRQDKAGLSSTMTSENCRTTLSGILTTSANTVPQCTRPSCQKKTKICRLQWTGALTSPRWSTRFLLGRGVQNVPALPHHGAAILRCQEPPRGQGQSARSRPLGRLLATNKL